MRLTSEEVEQITVDTLNGAPQRVTGPAAEAYRESLAKDIAKAKANGWTVAIPSEFNVGEAGQSNPPFVSSATANSGCGTGSGGFQPGNTCARGGTGPITDEPESPLAKDPLRSKWEKGVKDWGPSRKIVEAWAMEHLDNKDVDSELSKAPQFVGTVYRGVGSTTHLGPLEVGRTIEIGETLSTSRSPKVADKFRQEFAGDSPAVLMIHTAKKPLGDRSTFAAIEKVVQKDFKTEKEVAMLKGARLTIKSVSQRAGVTVIELEEQGGDTLNSGCGTGAGGFQPGNTCAKGGGISAGLGEILGKTSYASFSSSKDKNKFVAGALNSVASGLGIPTKVQVLDDAQFNSLVKDSAKKLGADPGLVRAVYHKPADTISFRTRTIGQVSDDKSYRLFMATAFHELGHAYERHRVGLESEVLKGMKDYDNSKREEFADVFGSRLGLVWRKTTGKTVVGDVSRRTDYHKYLEETTL